MNSLISDSPAYERRRRAVPYVVASDGRVLKYTGRWSTYAHVPVAETRHHPQAGSSSTIHGPTVPPCCPTGLAISCDRTHLVIALARSTKLLRCWIKDGTDKIDVRADGEGGYSVALHHETTQMDDDELDHLGESMSRIHGVRVGADGQVLREIRNPKTVRPMYQ